jgi:hypothetical protein
MRILSFTLLSLLFVSVFVVSCTEKNQTPADAVFEFVPSSQSGISFSNKLTENDSLNYFTYAYIYMGGGVSAGDINNDGLIDLYFTGNMVDNKLYLNKGNMQFEDITDVAGLAGDDRWYTGTTMTDINNDGFLDIYCSVGGKFDKKGNQLFVNNGDNTFTEQAKKYGIDDPSNSVQATFFDYDLDGDLDLYVANYPPTAFNVPNFHYAFKQRHPKELDTDRLYRNEGNSFVDVTKEAGLETFGLSLSATVSDLNQDGYPDLYVSNDFSTPDYLFINNQDGTFSEQVKKSTKNTSFYGMGVDIADFNNDGLTDIMQVDMTAQINRRAKANMASMNPKLFWSTVNSGFHYQYMQNSLQLNNGNLSKSSLPDFSNISRLAGVSSTDWSWSPVFADLDNDGWKDIYIANGTRREVNNRDFFKKIEKEGVSPEESLKMAMEIPSEKIANYVFKNNQDLSFSQVNKDWGMEEKTFSNGCVYADLDNDGDLEIITNNIDEAASVYENRSASRGNNHLTLRFKGSPKNPFGLGVKTILYADGIEQFQEMTLTRGFQSSVAPQLHYGLGELAKIDSLKIIWAVDKEQLITDLPINSIQVISYADASSSNVKEVKAAGKLFASVKDQDKILSHPHLENPYNDFEKEILLPHQTSMFGPNVAVGDLNGDNKDDIVVGAASRNITAVFLQENGSFIKTDSEAFAADIISEDLGIHIFDADSDGDNDIYVVSGGNEFSPAAPELQDRLYINDGRGNFVKNISALPTMLTSGSRVSSHDFDQDGDLDLIVGGRLIPGNYPSPADSYLLENRSTADAVSFVDITAKAAPTLAKAGMVTDVLWTDFNKDGWTDMIVIGEWMNLVALKNNEGKSFEDVSQIIGLEDTRGWWFSIEEADFDKDGDMDYVVGNLGENYKYKATEKETFDIFFNDFDNNQTKDIVLSYFNEGEQYPVRGRECSSQQMPAIKGKYKDYQSFSTATLEDVYTKEVLNNSLHYQVKSFASVYLENTGTAFSIHRLPEAAQISCINQILVDDYNQDGNLDALIAGNLHASEVETPRNDAGIGLLLEGNGGGGFNPVLSRESGFYVPGDVKDMERLTIDGQEYILVVKNSDFVQLVKWENGKERGLAPY